MSRKKLDEVNLFTDGGSRGNPGSSAIGIIITDKNYNELFSWSESIGEGTNNRAEYKALRKGLILCKKFTRNVVNCHSDSQLMINQMNGKYRIKNEDMKVHATKVQQLARKFESVTYNHVRREHPIIAVADSLLNEVLDDYV